VAVITIDAPESVEVPDGRFTVHPVEVAWRDRRDVYLLDVEPPHALVRIERGDNVYERTFLERAPYWRMHDVADVDALLPDTETDSAAVSR
jgi:hypothetical protein